MSGILGNTTAGAMSKLDMVKASVLASIECLPDLPALKAIADAGHGICSVNVESIVQNLAARGNRSIPHQRPLWLNLIMLAILLAAGPTDTKSGVRTMRITNCRHVGFFQAAQWHCCDGRPADLECCVVL